MESSRGFHEKYSERKARSQLATIFRRLSIGLVCRVLTVCWFSAEQFPWHHKLKVSKNYYTRNCYLMIIKSYVTLYV